MRAALHKLLEIAFFKNTQFLALESGFRPGFHAIFCAPGRPFRLRKGRRRSRRRANGTAVFGTMLFRLTFTFAIEPDPVAFPNPTVSRLLRIFETLLRSSFTSFNSCASCVSGGRPTMQELPGAGSFSRIVAVPGGTYVSNSRQISIYSPFQGGLDRAESTRN
jgi:hypothetical protein